jgi:hypothetical protein
MHPYFVGWAVNAHVGPTSALSGAEGSTLPIFSATATSRSYRLRWIRVLNLRTPAPSDRARFLSPCKIIVFKMVSELHFCERR